MMQITKRKIDIYTIQGKCEKGFNTWGEITLEIGEHSAKIMAHTDFGSYAYNWFSTGSNPVQFLKDITMDYAINKLSDYDAYEPDFDLYQKRIKDRIIDSRKEGDLSKDEARTAWEEMLPICEEYRDQNLIHMQLWEHDLFEKVFGEPECLPDPTKMKQAHINFWDCIWTPFVESL